MKKENIGQIASDFKTQVVILASFVAIMWIVEIADFVVFRGGLDRFGILPRHEIGLRGILLMPFLHGNFPHLIANTIPFITLGWLVMLRNTLDFWIATVTIVLVGGAGVWLFASPAYHIGASGLIFGYLGFLMLRGIFERSFAGIALSVIVGSAYGSLIWGVLPGRPGVSWEGHLFGFLSGVLAAYFVSRKTKSVL
ncbi:rhomboid family intramembrane serine protease [Oscillatoriales cyanobacterium LEGE 11467]|uniref:Rhomboid family intramembrane serine protease n=1 Tax=Zarconia navalis LEGE 11467 TaxID=1828826 RepID=A0A928VZM1_9CYAN|nr:rhomboid family intramembrane serine protease [Zarconia navalis]MBE9042183.1 rhomboid family intramembrane serine protease [Zarconia navalis LEGE 11467]